MLDERKQLQVEELRQKLNDHFEWLENQGAKEQPRKNDYIDATLNWQRTGMLAKLDDPYITMHIAMCMENQRLMNEICLDSKEDKKSFAFHDRQTFCRCAIPSVRKMYDPDIFLPWHIVSVQTLIGPTGLVNYTGWKKPDFVEEAVILPVDGVLQQVSGRHNKDGSLTAFEWNQEEVAAKTRKMKATWCYQEDLRGKPLEETLDYEITLVREFANHMANEIGREVCTDIRNNAGTIATVDSANGVTVSDALQRLSDAIERKIGFQANWIIGSPEVIKTLPGFVDSGLEASQPSWGGGLGIRNAGTVGNWRAFEDPLFPVSQIIMGYKDHANPYHSGYFYLPYVPLGATPVILDAGFCPRPGVLTRYAKKLLRGGAKFYGRLSIK